MLRDKDTLDTIIGLNLYKLDITDIFPSYTENLEYAFRAWTKLKIQVPDIMFTILSRLDHYELIVFRKEEEFQEKRPFQKHFKGNELAHLLCEAIVYTLKETA